MLEKKQLRKDVLARRELLTWKQVEENSKRIAEKLFTLPEYMSAQTVMFFLNFGKEVQTLEFVPQALLQGKRVIAPKTVSKERQMLLSEIVDVGEDLALGLWDIPEPKAENLRLVEPAALDFVTVPGVAFDVEGNRLGYGGGYYDRFFARLREDVPLVALTFELQMQKSIPVDAWDRRVDIIITEERIIRCTSCAGF